MNKGLLAVLALVAGVAGGYLIARNSPSMAAPEAASSANEPLYWVAPMDPNFKRDKPGLSPMGMDLVPVYAEDLAGDDSPGMVSIASEVVNNLGVKTAPVRFAPLQAEVETVGYVSYDQTRLVDLHSRISGWVESAAVSTDGDYVEAGQLLYEVYSPELVNAQEEYLAALNSGNRYLRAASRSKLLALGVSEPLIKELQAQRKPFNQVPVYAPTSGYVSNLTLRPGTFIKPATLLMRIGALDQVWVTAELFERQAAQVKVGDPVTMSLAFMPGQQWQGEVDYIYPMLDQKTRTLQLRLRFDNPQQVLKPDMFARLQILTQPTEPVLSVPDEAVIITGAQTRVVVALEEGRYKSVEVTPGASMGGRTAILHGLYPEDQVVVSAQFLLDSESSISSDFARMSPPAMGGIEEVWVTAQVHEIDPEARLLTVEHGAIREWEQPQMLMQVPAAETLDLSALNTAPKADGPVQLLLRGGNMSELQLVDYVLPQPKAPRRLSESRP